jgi:hypothetical protein
MRIAVRSILNRWTLLVLFLLPLLVGCCTQMFETAIEFAKSQGTGATDVAIILLEPDRKYYPDRLLVKNKVHMIVWIAEADRLSVSFKDPKPPGVDVKCSTDFKFLCYTTTPFKLSPGDPNRFKYTATVQCKGKDPVTIDPEVEIVF